jgi:hypothetical protein
MFQGVMIVITGMEWRGTDSDMTVPRERNLSVQSRLVISQYT